MPGELLKNVRSDQRLLYAHLSCLCLGLALLLWGLAPAIVDRVLTGRSPSFQTLALDSLTILVGLTFIGLHRLIRGGVRWALWTAFIAALVFTTAAVGASVYPGGFRPSLFPLIFAAGTTLTTWLAITAARDQALSPHR